VIGEGVTSPTVRVVVVTYSPGPLLKTCLDSLADACSRPYDVVLADNGSVDGYPERLATRPGVRLVPTGGNLGYGTAANVGAAAEPAAPWILVCNPDVRFGRAAVDTMLDTAERWPRGGSFGPAIFDPEGELYPSARRVPRLGVGSAHAVLGLVWADNPWTRRYTQRDRTAWERAVGWLSGACLLVRREAWEDVGGFDTGYFMYFEDVDLGDRLGRAGWQNVYVPLARVTHVGAHSTGRTSVQMLAAHHTSAARFVSDRYPRPVARAASLGLYARLRLLARRRDAGGPA
jgi:N-acetylglucosaminyl-diphospho-decaprenol L-rhamnosyltransferase